MPTAVVRIIAEIQGTVIGSTRVEPSAQTFDDALGELEYMDLASGANTITRPTSPESATGVIIVPPTDNTDTITLKGVSGDTGVPISPDSPTWIPFAASPPTNFVLTTGGAIPGVLFAWI